MNFISLLNQLHCSAVPNWLGLGYWEEKQANWDFPLLSCSGHRELFHVHGWYRILATINKNEESWCCNLQLIHGNHNALLCTGEGSVPIQILECPWLGFWRPTSFLWNPSLQKELGRSICQFSVWREIFFCTSSKPNGGEICTIVQTFYYCPSITSIYNTRVCLPQTC